MSRMEDFLAARGERFEVTRTATFSLLGLRRGIVTLPDGVIYFRIPTVAAVGTEPPAPEAVHEECHAGIRVVVRGGPPSGYDDVFGCTLEKHDASVPHIACATVPPGFPLGMALNIGLDPAHPTVIASWTDA